MSRPTLDPGTGGAWWRRKQAGSKASRTAGRQKGENCKASPLDRWFAKHHRSYKDKGYAAWCYKIDLKRKNKGG